VCVVVAAGCASSTAWAQVDPATFTKEEIIIQAGDFSIAGDLYLPAQGARHPLVVWVHGSGAITRGLMAPLIGPQIDIFLKAGFAFFMDDIPGSGASTGQITSVFTDRALILSREIEELSKRPDIIADRIGVAGVSQAGIVMPLAASMTPLMSFMVTEACVAECSYRQDAYLAEQLAICDGMSPESGADIAKAIRLRYETDSFAEYVAAAEKVNANDVCKQIGLNRPLFTEDRFKKRDKSPERLGAYFDPVPFLCKMSMPVLALFGGQDKNIDSRQGVDAYHKALAGRHSLTRIETIAGANHMLYLADTGCVRELMAQVAAGEPRYDPQALAIIAQWLDQLKKSFEDEDRSRG
jgi:hypothetical protein